jgi:hypothetical protein
MEEILNFQNITTLVILIIYGTIFFIQKAQFRKQKEVLEKYEKIFDIINIDEIEKYVKLQKKSLELSFSNRETELKNIEVKYDKTYNDVKTILNSSKTNFEKSDEIIIALSSILNKNNHFVKSLMELNSQEFEEIHKTLEVNFLKLDDNKLKNQINKELMRINKKYDSLKRDELKKI